MSGYSNLAGTGPLEGHRYWASGYWHWDGSLQLADVSGENLELVTGQSPHGGLYLRALARDGVMLRQKVHEVLARQREFWRLPQVDFARYANLFS